MTVEIAPQIVFAPAGSGHSIVLRWQDLKRNQKSFFLLNPPKEHYPGMIDFILEARVVYVGPLITFSNEVLIKYIAKTMQEGMMSWMVLVAIPWADQERPCRTFPLEIADIKRLTLDSVLPLPFHNENAIEETRKFGYDRLG